MAISIALGAMAGLIAGSFLSTLILRWPEDRGMGGRSACDGCASTLTWLELVPLLSYLRQRGRCAACGAPIDRMHPAMELSCAVAGGAAMAVAPGWAGGTGALFGWLLITLAVLDLRYFWLPDRLTLLLAATGLLSGLADPSITYADRMIGGLAGFAGLWAIAWIYRKARGREGLGGGDPKLFGAIGLWLGWQVLPFVLLGASGVGLMVVLILMLRGRAVTATMRVPFGTLLATAAFSAWLLMR